MAPKVQASEMMNSHITSFFDGTAKGDGSITAACPAPGPATACAFCATLASLTVPPLTAGLQLQPQHKQKVHPQQTHEVPVVRSGIDGASAQGTRGSTKFHHDPSQPAQASDHVDDM